MTKKNELLLECEITVTVTNDGNENKVSISFTNESPINEIFTALELGKQNMETMLGIYIDKLNQTNGHPVSEADFKQLFSTLRVGDMVNQVQQNS